MDKERIKQLLQQVKDGRLGIDDALEALKIMPYEKLDFVCLDMHRDLRKGFPEVIFCSGKTREQIVKIVERMSAAKGAVMATRADREVYLAIKKVREDAVYYETARIVFAGKRKRKTGKKAILVVSAGTSDLPVAEEAAVTSEIMGNRVERLYDIGVAGIHRLFAHQEKLFRAGTIIVVAGMEGALASIIGGLVDRPVIAVPTSVGYGANFRGLSALLSMLSCCAPGVAVMNIDNGFGAGYFASLIN